MSTRLIINWGLIFSVLFLFTFAMAYSVYAGGMRTAYAEVVTANPDSAHFIAFQDSPARNARGIVSRVFTSLANTFDDQFICAVKGEQLNSIKLTHITRDEAIRVGEKLVSITHVRDANAAALRAMVGPDTCRIGNNLSYFFLLFAANLS